MQVTAAASHQPQRVSVLTLALGTTTFLVTQNVDDPRLRTQTSCMMHWYQ